MTVDYDLFVVHHDFVRSPSPRSPESFLYVSCECLFMTCCDLDDSICSSWVLHHEAFHALTELVTLWTHCKKVHFTGEILKTRTCSRTVSFNIHHSDVLPPHADAKQQSDGGSVWRASVLSGMLPDGALMNCACSALHGILKRDDCWLIIAFILFSSSHVIFFFYSPSSFTTRKRKSLSRLVHLLYLLICQVSTWTFEDS